jgi:hypothetical protein
MQVKPKEVPGEKHIVAESLQLVGAIHQQPALHLAWLQTLR